MQTVATVPLRRGGFVVDADVLSLWCAGSCHLGCGCGVEMDKLKPGRGVRWDFLCA